VIWMLLLGVMIGGAIGVFFMALVNAGSKADAHMRWDGKDGEG